LSERLLDAALEEFSTYGFAGARVQRICANTGVSVNLLYYYFDSKEGLYRAVLERLTQRLRQAGERTPSANAALPFVEGYDVARDPQIRTWLRLILWTELQHNTSPALDPPSYRAHLSNIQQLQVRNELPQDIPAADLILAQIALSIFPLLVPGLTKAVTDLDPDDPEFVRRWTHLLTRLADAVTHAPPKPMKR
jgi:AcrR family transcriptional regulator